MSIYEKNGSWWIDYYEANKRKREKIGPSKKLAENVLRKRKVAIAENRHLDVKKNAKIKFEDFASTFLELYSKPNKRSWERDEILIKHLSGCFSGKYLYEITPMMIEQYKVDRGKEVSAATVNREIACLKCMFNRAIEWNKADNNPMSKVRLLKESNARMRFLERDEIKRLVDSCNDQLRPVVLVALHTGMRKSEILNLKWRDIDINQEIIYLYDSKNGDKREIPMNNRVKKVFIQTLRNPKHEYIFCNRDGEPYSDIRTAFFTALKKGCIINFTFHDLRHTYASHLVMAGVDLKTVQELLGHKSIEMTMRYSHLSPSHKKHAADILGSRMDTIWTPGANKGDSKESGSDSIVLKLKELDITAPVAQMDRALVS